MLKTYLLFCFFIFATTAQALDFGNVKATLDRYDRKKLILSVELPNATTTDQSTLGIVQNEVSEIQQAFVNHLDICPAVDETQTGCSTADIKVKWTLERKPTPQDSLHLSTTEVAEFVSGRTIATQNQTDSTIWSYNVDILITNSEEEYAVGQTVFMRLFPDKADVNQNKDKSVDIQLGSGVADAVEVISVPASKGSINVVWTKDTEVTFQDESTSAPSGVAALLIPNVGTDPISIPTKTYVADPSTSSATDPLCSITASNLGEADESCTISCESSETKTLDLDATLPADFQLKTVTDPNQQVVSFSGLTLEEGPYAIILQYLPEGTALGCYLARPSDAATLIQLASGQEPKAGDPNCFIATAAYGSALDPHLHSLRWFRDTYLLSHELGRSFTRSYYRYSPPIAKWIAERPLFRSLVRGMLWLPVTLIEGWRDLISATEGTSTHEKP